MLEKGTNKGELPPEVDKYLRALVKDPKSKAFVPLADIYRKAGMIDEAIQVAKDGLKHNPNYVSGRLVLGRCYFDKEMLKEAEDEISKVVRVNPENAEAQRVLAKIKEKTGRIDEAIKTWDIVLTLIPNDAEAKQKIDEFKKSVPVEEKREPEPAVEVTEEKAEVKVEEKREEEKKSEEIIAGQEKPLEEQQATLEEISVQEKEEVIYEKVHEVTKIEEPQVERTEPKLAQQKETTVKKEPTEISTSALAELYVKQGFLERALKIYKELEASSPEDEEIKKQIDFINAELDKKKMKEPKEIKFKENIKTLSSWLDKIKRGG